ncbi:MAG: DUF3293 domain-containing protein [Blastomonas sp.]
MAGTKIADELVAAYRDTEFLVGPPDVGFILRVGRRSDEIASLLRSADGNGATFITAENPFSQTLTAQENAINQAHLRTDLIDLGATVLEGQGQGQDKMWPPESSFLAIGLTHQQACDLGTKYQQNAIVWIGLDLIPELVLLN